METGKGGRDQSPRRERLSTGSPMLRTARGAASRRPMPRAGGAIERPHRVPRLDPVPVAGARDSESRMRSRRLVEL